MLRAIEAAQVTVSDVTVKPDDKTVRLYVKKSKTDQKAQGTWRTLGCCSMPTCVRDCAYNLAFLAFKDVEGKPPSTPLFPDVEGNLATKLHMVTAWSNHLDERATGHSARRSGAMAYARKGMPIQSIQFLGRWKSSAVFRYVEEAMAEVPMNSHVPRTPGTGAHGAGQETEFLKRKSLSPKQKASPKKTAEGEQPVPIQESENDKEKVYALSNARGKWTKHLVGQAAWGAFRLTTGPPYVGGTLRRRMSRWNSPNAPRELQCLARSATSSWKSATESKEPENGRQI
jgi:hypothetical protein